MVEELQKLIDRILYNPALEISSPLLKRLLPLLRLPFALIRDIAGGELNRRAMSLVYTTMLSIVPLIALSFSVLKGLGVHNELEPILLEFFSQMGDQGPKITEKILDYVDNVKGGVLGVAGLAFLIYTVVSMVQKVEEAFNYVWQVEKPRSFGQRFSEYLSVILIGPLVMVLALGSIASISSNSVVQRLTEIEPFGTTIVLLGKLVPFFMVVLLFSFVYAFVPNTRVKIRYALGGGLVAGVMWAMMAFVFARFVGGSGTRTAVYAGFAIVLISLIWLYLNWLILLLGAQISFYLQRPEYMQRGRSRIEPTGELREGLALEIMLRVGQSFRDHKRRWTVNDLAGDLQIPATVLTPIVDRLIKLDMLAVTESEFLLPGSEMGRTTVANVLDAVRENQEIPGLHWDPKVRELTSEVNESIEKAVGNKTLADILK